MSAFIVGKPHLDYLIAAGLQYGKEYKVRWMAPTTEIPANVHQRGAPWGPGAEDYYRNRERKLSVETAAYVGMMLTAENRKSVDHRYNEKELEDLYECDAAALEKIKIDPVQVLKAISCLEYQSNEHPEWETSEAKIFCDALRGAAIHELPGYDKAQWEVR